MTASSLVGLDVDDVLAGLSLLSHAVGALGNLFVAGSDDGGQGVLVARLRAHRGLKVDTELVSVLDCGLSLGGVKEDVDRERLNLGFVEEGPAILGGGLVGIAELLLEPRRRLSAVR